MPGISGIDPGVLNLGLAHVARGRWVASETLHGPRGSSKDWGVLGPAAQGLAAQAVDFVREYEPEAVAVETMVDQRGRKAHSHKHTTAAVCQAIWDAFTLAGLEDLIVWQDAVKVLAHTTGYGDLKYLLEVGRAGLHAPGPLNEHEASAVVHALWLETARHARLAGLPGS